MNAINKILIQLAKVLIFCQAIKIFQIFIAEIVNSSPQSLAKLNSTSVFLVFSALTLLLKFRFSDFIVCLILGFTNMIAIYSSIHTYNNFKALTVLLVLLGSKPIFAVIFKNEILVEKGIAFLIIFQISTIYFFSALSKINYQFLTGGQIIDVLHPTLVFPNLEDPFPFLYVLLAFGTVALEFVLAFQILFRNSFIREIQLLGYVFHVLILLSLNVGAYHSVGLLVFLVVMTSIYPLIITENWQNSNWVVFWDTSCGFCNDTINIAKKFDNLGKFEFYSNRLIDKFKHISFDSKLANDTIIIYNLNTHEYYTASRAIIFLFGNNFYFWPILGLLNFKVLIKLFDKAYYIIASRRMCKIN